MNKSLQTIAHGLILVSAMLAVIAAALWLRGVPWESNAQAQPRIVTAKEDGGIPDAGKQRMQTVEQLQELNKRLADMDQALRSGAYTMQTVVPKSDKASAKVAPKDEQE